MTRRSLIERVLLLLGIDVAGLVGCVSRRVVARDAPPLRAVPGATSELPSTEIDDLVAFGEVLVEGRVLGPVERQSLVEHIADRIRRDPEYLSLYGTTVRTLNRLAGRRFSSLEVDHRIELIAGHGLAGSTTAQVEELDPLPAEAREIRTVRRRVSPDLIREYYASAGGWAVVGYEAFPGRCGDLARYTRAEP